ncbi:serine carboxypeptidase S28-domain-containing protein [Aspergillus unguis]
MRFALSLSTALVALFSGSVTGVPLRSDLAKKLQLATELGLDTETVLRDSQTFRTAATQADIPAEYVTLPIDHDNPSFGTFQNRFWVSEEYYEPGGPVIMYDTGELNAETSTSHLTSDFSFFPRLLKEFNAIGIIWEHRYYGDSLPYPVHPATPPDHFRYLTTSQALADIPVFAENFTRPDLPHVDLTPKSTPWVMVGGSYAGARAALARNEYPDTIFASFASSGPVEARVDMSAYYKQVYQAMVANGFGNCARDIHAALHYIDDQLSRNGTSAAIKKLFFGEGAEYNSNEDFTASLATIFGYFQSQGFEGGKDSLDEFCRHMELDPSTGQYAGSEGLAPRHGNEYLAKRWAAWPVFTEMVNANTGTNCRGLDKSTERSCKLNPPPSDPSSIAWSWQYCSEWGFYQSNNVGVHSLLSRYQTLEFQQVMCNQLFPDAVKSGILPKEPRVHSLNEHFGGWSIRPSNVYFSSGEFDPWRTLGMLSEEPFSQQLNVTQDIPRCGVPPADDTVFGYIGANSFHCFDFQMTDIAGESRELFTRALKAWLPCFEKK